MCWMHENRSLPFTIDGDNLRFFSGAPGTVRVQMGDRETVYSLTLPDVGEAVWRVPASVHKGVPRPFLGGRRAPRSVAVAGAAGRNRAAGGLAAVWTQPGVPLASVACDSSL